jgi:hypothetical protein
MNSRNISKNPEIIFKKVLMTPLPALVPSALDLVSLLKTQSALRPGLGVGEFSWEAILKKSAVAE